MNVIDLLLENISADAEVEDVVIGVFECMVVSRAAGLSSTFRKPCEKGGNAGCESPHGVRSAGDLIGMSALRLAGYAKSDNLLEASVGVAALNSLIEPQPSALTRMNAYELIANRASGKRVAVVGHFPFVERLKGIAEVRLVQKEPWEREEALRDAEEKIPGCEVVAITGSSLINQTFDRLLELSRGAYVIVLGASTPMLPLLFGMGASALCGTVVEDMDIAKRFIMQGATFREMGGIRRVAMLSHEAGASSG